MRNVVERSRRRWVAQSSELLWRAWDDHEVVVYHIPSGNTHVLNLVAAEALHALERDALDSSELVERVASSLETSPDDTFGQHIEKLLAQFDELGLIEPVL
jgi:PqqD family protein of HPr-rel-A system